MDNQAKISACKICLLADAMKHCESCPFRVGLAVKALQACDPTESEVRAHVMKIRQNIFSNRRLTPL